MKINEKIDNLKQMSVEELQKELDKYHTEAVTSRIELSADKNAKSSDATYKRKMVARILTLINEKTHN